MGWRESWLQKNALKELMRNGQTSTNSEYDKRDPNEVIDLNDRGNRRFMRSYIRDLKRSGVNDLGFGGGSARRLVRRMRNALNNFGMQFTNNGSIKNFTSPLLELLHSPYEGGVPDVEIPDIDEADLEPVPTVSGTPRVTTTPAVTPTAPTTPAVTPRVDYMLPLTPKVPTLEVPRVGYMSLLAPTAPTTPAVTPTAPTTPAVTPKYARSIYKRGKPDVWKLEGQNPDVDYLEGSNGYFYSLDDLKGLLDFSQDTRQLFPRLKYIQIGDLYYLEGDLKGKGLTGYNKLNTAGNITWLGDAGHKFRHREKDYWVNTSNPNKWVFYDLNRHGASQIDFKYKKGGMLKFLQGGQIPEEITKLVQAAALGDQEALQLYELVKQAANSGDGLASQILQMILTVAQLLGVLLMRRGAAINYFKRIRGVCPEGEEMTYFKVGGKVGCGCKKKAPKKELGGVIDDRSDVIKEFEAFRCGGKMKKKEQGGVVSEKCGGKTKKK